jgi:pimeloyl-ACP methyl ester carboxylesterase
MTLARQRLDAPAWIDLFLKALVIGPYRETVDPAVLARCREMVTDTVRDHVRPDAVPPSHLAGSWERLSEIRVPALGLYGDQDAPDHIAMVKRFASRVPGAEIAVIPAAGHVSNMERPAEFNAILLGFLRSAARRAG